MHAANAVTAVLGVAGVGLGAAARRSTLKWKTNRDPTGGVALDIEGRSSIVNGTDGVRLHCIEAGTGPTVVLVPGYGANSGSWAPVVQRLVATGHRVVTYDLRGQGRSGTGRTGVTLTGLGLDLRAVLEHHDVSDATLVGHSLGGLSALMLLTDHGPATAPRINNLVLASVAARSPVDLANSVPKASSATMIDHRPLCSGLLAPFVARPLFGRAPSTRLLDETAANLASLTPGHLWGLLTMLASFDLTDQLGLIDIPVEVVVGDRDVLVPGADARSLADHLPNASLTVLRGVGHSIPVEAPAAVSAAIGRLRSQPADRHTGSERGRS